MSEKGENTGDAGRLAGMTPRLSRDLISKHERLSQPGGTITLKNSLYLSSGIVTWNRATNFIKLN